MDSHFIISRMQAHEIPMAIQWAKEEGWNPGLHDATCFYQADPHGFFVGKLDGKIIAMGSAVVYDDHFAFCGLFIVNKAYRDRGYGLALTKERLNYVGDRNAGIDGVLSMVSKYERIGYKIAHNNARFYAANPLVSTALKPEITALSNVPFQALSDYDRLHFPARREQFLKCWITQVGGASLGFIREDQLMGYGVIRPCFSGYKIGPLFANTKAIADALFSALVKHADGIGVYIDIPESNLDAVALVKDYKLEKVFSTARMYLKGPPPILLNQVYGITTFELG